MKNAKIIGTVIGIALFIALVAGATYAWFTWRSSSINISGTSGCFVIDYGISKEIGASSMASLKLGSSYNDGLTAEVTAKINDSCTGVTGTGTLYLNTNVTGTSTAILKGALKYAVISEANGTTPIATGVISSTGKNAILSNIDLDTATTRKYTVYVWIDGVLADNTYADATYSGFISLEATQN